MTALKSGPEMSTEILGLLADGEKVGLQVNIRDVAGGNSHTRFVTPKLLSLKSKLSS